MSKITVRENFLFWNYQGLFFISEKNFKKNFGEELRKSGWLVLGALPP